jgi:hypothetical protein
MPAESTRMFKLIDNVEDGITDLVASIENISPPLPSGNNSILEFNTNVVEPLASLRWSNLPEGPLAFDIVVQRIAGGSSDIVARIPVRAVVTSARAASIRTPVTQPTAGN